MKFNPLHRFKVSSDSETTDRVPANADMGWGDKVARQPGTRLINNDGSFNVVRKGRRLFAPYQELVEMSWIKFLSLTLLAYVSINALFAVGFLIIGTDSLSSVERDWPFWERALGAFFFSVQTFTTVGYGGMAPIGIAANFLSAFLALFGWVALAIVTGLFYARFSRPSRMVAFSDRALMSPMKNGGMSLQFRIVNQRDNHLINVSTRVTLTWLEYGRRRFAPLELERDTVPLFPLNWTIVHAIVEDSPMNGWTKEDYCRRHSELLVTVDGYDETFAQTIHLKNSYLHHEIEWNARFEPMYIEREQTTELHLDRLHAYSILEEE